MRNGRNMAPTGALWMFDMKNQLFCESEKSENLDKSMIFEKSNRTILYLMLILR